MLRKTLTILSLIGLLLSVGLWGVSYFRIGLVRATPRDPKYPKWTPANVYRLSHGTLWYTQSLVKGGTLSLASPLHEIHGFNGFETHWVPRIQTYREFWNDNSLSLSYVIIPLWIPTGVFIVLFMSCRPLHFHRRRKRKKLGLCFKCGYDLRGSTETCPECGEPFSGELTATADGDCGGC